MITNRKGVFPKTDRPPAVVIGVQHVTALNTVWSLAQTGVPVLGITSRPASPIARTRKCRIVHCPDVNSDALIDTLLELGRSLECRAVLFPCSDEQVSVISEKRELLAPYYLFNLPSKEVVRMLLCKAEFASYAGPNGYPIPKSLVIDRFTDLPACLGDFRFPCLLKPDHKNAEWNRHSRMNKVLRLRDREEALRVIGQALQWVERLVLQEWISGGDSDVYFCLMYFDRNSEPRATFVGRKIRQWLPEIGSTAIAEKRFSTTVLNESVRLFKALRYQGLGSVEFKQDAADQSFKITEPTVGRPNFQSYLAVANGINIPHVAYSDLTGQSVTVLDGPARAGSVKWIDEWHEYQSSLSYWRAGKLTLKDWARSVSGPRCYALLSLSDPLPFVLSFKGLGYGLRIRFLLFLLALLVRTRKAGEA
jgi:predicted ATP-grasp superfamily ATP-dependent carboligase